jgi:hypothetical protein
LPPQACRILAGEQEWRDVHAGEWGHGSRQRIPRGLVERYRMLRSAALTVVGRSITQHTRPRGREA